MTPGVDREPADEAEVVLRDPRPLGSRRVEWDGTLDRPVTLGAGDRLLYTLRVYDETGRIDRTATKIYDTPDLDNMLGDRLRTGR